MVQAVKYGGWSAHSQTSARELITISNNATWSDAYQFDEPTDTTWNLNGCMFELDVQRNPYDQVPLLSLSTANGRIITDDPVQRVIHFHVPAEDIQSSLDPGVYVYDLVMTDAVGTRWAFMHGTLTVGQGVSYPP